MKSLTKKEKGARIRMGQVGGESGTMSWGKSLRELEAQSCRRDIQIYEGLFC